MGIELPPELAEVAAQTGVKWPTADEDKMREAAQAWRDTGTKLTTLIKDADTSAQSALNTTAGAGADQARSHWDGYVKPDSGHLTSVANGCTAAADQLEHAAEQIGAAKVAIVRNLVPLANHKDVAQHAAAVGNPAALLGLDTAVKGTAANVANVHNTLVTAVQPTTGVVVDTTQSLVDTTPGVREHAQGLLPVDTSHPGALSGVLDPGAGHGGWTEPGAVAAGVLDPVLPDPGHGGWTEPGAGHGGTLDPGGQLGSGGGHGGVLDPVVGQLDPAGGHGGTLDPGSQFGGHGGTLDPVPGIEPATGPIPLPGHEFLHDAPTPPTGIPVTQDHGVHVAAAAPAVLDAPPPTQAPPVSPGQVTSGPVAGSPVGGPSFVPGSPAPMAPPPASAPAPSPGPSPSPSPVPPQRGPVPGVMPVDPGRQAQPVHQAPAAVPTHVPPAKQDEDQITALWLVRMFPIGHMPVASARPSRQLPPPSPEYDYAPGMRFEPHDHPDSDLISAAEPVPAEPSTPEEEAVVDGLAVGYDPLAGGNERDWDRRFVVRPGSGRDTMDIEYAWPPSELFPEGATAPGEPVILEPGRVIDRFGTPEGRVFAADSTAFGRRSLPPSHLRSGYRRYRVLRPLPVWRGISAAWFAQSGGGVRYRTVYPARELVALGYLAQEFGTGEIIDEG
jgi:nicrotizing toxin Mtb-like protein